METMTSKTDLSALQIEAYWLVRPEQGALCDELPPPTSQQHVGVRTIYTGFEPETERLLFLGGAGGSFGRSLGAPHCVGDFPAPIKYGDSAVGRVEVGPDNLRNKRVFVPYPHQSFFSVHRDAVYEIPPDVSDKQALLTSEMLRALSAVWTASPQPGERVLVLGSGTTALLIGYVLEHHHNLRVEFCPTTPLAERLAEGLNLRVVTYESATSPLSCLLHSCPFNDTLSWGVRQLQPKGRAVDVSYHLTLSQSLELPSSALAQGCTLSFVHPLQSPLPLSMSLPERYRAALSLLSDPRLDVLFDASSLEFSELPAHISEISANAESVCYQKVRYPMIVRDPRPPRTELRRRRGAI